MSNQKCRWGILGTAGIARKNWQSIYHSGNGQLVGVASRTVERAQEYIDENQAQIPHDPPPRPFGTYEEMLNSDEIDAVYIPLPTGIRKDWVLKAAAAGKHVLSEKPCGTNAAQVQEQIDACNAAGVQYMDGVMFMHSDRMPKLREALDDGESVGEVRRITSQFSFQAPEEFLKENIRMHSDLEPLGSLGDLGWYNIRIALWAMNFQMPTRVSGRMITQSGRPDSPDAVPIQFSSEMVFPDNVTASIYCSFDTDLQQWCHISGTKGSIWMDDFVVPAVGANANFTVQHFVTANNICQFRMEKHEDVRSVREYSDSHETAQETKLFRKFSELVLGGKPDSYWPEIALKTQQVLDACLASARDGGKEVEL